MLERALLWIEVRYRAAAREAALRPDGTRLKEQALRQQCLARAGRSDRLSPSATLGPR
jgi:hypothetical protein